MTTTTEATLAANPTPAVSWPSSRISADRGGVEALMEAGELIAAPVEIEPGDDVETLVHVVPSGGKVVVTDVRELREKYADHPPHKKGIYLVGDVQSFLAYFTKHRTPSAEVWVSKDRVHGALDAHSADTPSFEHHNVVLGLELSAEWRAWTGISGQLLPQARFAEFLLEQAHTIVNPSMGIIYEIAETIQGQTNVEWKSSYRAKDGQRGFKYEERVDSKAGAKGDLEIPDVITLALRIHRSGPPIEVSARLRWRLRSGAIELGVVIDAQDVLIDGAVASLRDELEVSIADENVLVLTR